MNKNVEPEEVSAIAEVALDEAEALFVAIRTAADNPTIQRLEKIGEALSRHASDEIFVLGEGIVEDNAKY